MVGPKYKRPPIAGTPAFKEPPPAGWKEAEPTKGFCADAGGRSTTILV